jgi:CheY-like chemotaxis protein
VPKTILIVEDNAIAREGLAVLLRRESYDVVLTADGQQALDLLHEGLDPGLVLLDMLMPVLDGWGFLEVVKRLQPPLTGPIIVMSGKGVIGREWARAHRCAGYLRKPVIPEWLLKEVRRCLGEGEPTAPASST